MASSRETVEQVNRAARLGSEGRYEAAIAILHPIVQAAPDLLPAVMNLGLCLRGVRRGIEALACFDKALALRPDLAPAALNRAAVLMELGRTRDAIAGFERTLVLDPANADARHMLNALRGDAAAAPDDDYVRTLFDSYAASFDKDLVEALDYRIPWTLRRMADALGRTSFARGLDLGCGTGLIAEAFAPHVAEWIGVDLAPRMIAEARRKGRYAVLQAAEIGTYLTQEMRAFELIVAADVFVYVGALDPIFAQAKAHLRADGLFGFSVEGGTDDQVRLQPTGRFSHGRGYIERLAAEHELSIAAIEAATIRKHGKDGIPGWAVLLRN
jgi:predicted TPR repeat methyltransferase